MMIDIHSHFFPRLSQQQSAAFGDDWPWLRDDGDGRGQIMVGDKEFRPARAPLWDPDVRRKDIEALGIDYQLVCATPLLFAYGRDPAAASAFAQLVNDAALTFCNQHPDRFAPLCQVPLQDTARACDELDRCLAAGHVGVQIGTHVGDRDLDDGDLMVFLEHCAARGAAILVHPWDMPPDTRKQPYMLQWLVGMPAETHLSVLRLILSGAFERLPETLKICFAHGGGAFASQIGRVDNAWTHRDIVREDCPQLPSSYTKHFATDSIVFEPEMMSLLAETMSTERIMFGTDYPFPLGDQTPGTMIRNHPALTSEAKDKLLHANAIAFFGLESRMAG